MTLPLLTKIDRNVSRLIVIGARLKRQARTRVSVFVSTHGWEFSA